MNRIFLILIIIGVPVSVVGSFLHWPPILMFILDCVTIVGLASFMGRATESLAIVAGPSIGGLLNATFGNAVELIISIFAIKAGLINVVLASITGSIIGNLLLVGGLSFFVGGLKYKRQRFNIYEARHNAGMLIFAIVVSFVFPLIFSMELGEADAKILSIGISIVMIIIYLAALFFKLVTHRGVYKQSADEAEHDGEEEPEWSAWKAITVLAGATIAVGYISENLVHTFEPVAKSFGWTELFIGVIIVAIVGNAAEHASAILMAYKNRMTVTVEIAIGSTLQIAMFVAPLLVLLSLAFPTFMPLIFSVPELIVMILAVFLTIAITNDGDTNWFEGAILLAAYLIMGFGFFLL
ncbi:Ca2+:H+ antiporter [Scopulibacillus darangshiensis]|uniref:Ca(2+)/H(+) antiporter n=1 Tax=Scopulibacillus darangshiensis TaxID=442528 RepID=A0A4R2NSW4_9BACL|nr:calcium/proton exchanger [Scopulibacillus darangshiensis]TCP24882.1 Ca2+:H+ antiporter [Scopulibacillus darangshiensis]